MITLKIAFRNALRQKRKTILTALTITVSYTLAAISIGWSDGSYSHVIDMFTRHSTGHIQVHHKGYLDKPSLYNTIHDYKSIGNQIQSVKNVKYWCPRLYSAGLSSVDKQSAGIQIIGIDPERETDATEFDKRIISGKMLPEEPSHEAILGKGLAKILKADVGSDIVLVSQGADGSIANDMYRVDGIAKSDNDITDRISCYLHIKDAQDLLVLNDQVHEILIIISSLNQVDELNKAIEMRLNNPELEVSLWQEVAKSFYQAMKADKEGMWIMLFVVILIVAVEVLNTVLMSVLERTREYGILKAVGTRPTQIFRLVLYEVFIIAVVSSVIGAGLSIVANYYLSTHGIILSQPFSYGGVVFQKMQSVINARSFYLPAIITILSGTFISIFPAVKAACVAPAKAMRMR